jgi:hypothetical protein
LEEETPNEKEKGFLSWFKGKFSKSDSSKEEDEKPQYKRKLFDGRIEKYLDKNLDAFISEYGIVTGLDLEVYDQRYNRLTGRIHEMSEFMADADAYVTALENNLKEVQKASKES